MEESILKPVIKVDKDKCVNCHRCITVCPSKFCNDGSKDYVKINHNLCIGCGACISACTHGARIGIDDFDTFMTTLHRGENIVAVVAPAAAANFKGEELRLNGWLKSIGVRAVFDVSFGAELTTKSYVEYIKENNPKLVISQPCPALVTYLELYKPELLQYLIPVDSPMAHTFTMIKTFFPKYNGCKLAAISPCYAKKREFDENHLGDFNVTMRSISEYFDKNNIDLKNFPEVPYDNPMAERAVLYSSPGGLMRTAERFIPGISEKTRKIEGQPLMKEYFNDLAEIVARNYKIPYLLIDCLNCEKGCNGGAGTINQKEPLDVLESYVENRMQKRKKALKIDSPLKKVAQKNLDNVIDKYWKPNIYTRQYNTRSQIAADAIKYPTEEQLEKIYEKMGKHSQKDFLNCGACGYDTCKEMAIALFNGINQYSHCHHYLISKNNEIEKVLYKEIQTLRVSTKENAATSQDQSAAVKEIVATMEDTNVLAQAISNKIKDVAGVAGKTTSDVRNGVEELSRNVEKLHAIFEANKHTIDGIKSLNTKIDNIWDIVTLINSVADQAKIIAFNAELEASSAGESGKNFHIVATEIRRLANGIIDATKDIKNHITEIQQSSDSLILSSENGTAMITEGCENAKNLEKRFDSIKTSSEITASSAAEITSIIEQQTYASEQILITLKQIASGVENFSSATDYIATSAETLNNIATKMSEEKSDIKDTTENKEEEDQNNL